MSRELSYTRFAFFTRTRSILILACCAIAAVVVATILSSAATPSSGTLTEISGPLTYSAGPFTGANPTPVIQVDSGPECNNPSQPCDDYHLTVTLTAVYHAAHPNASVKVTMGWTDTGSGKSDYDLYIYKLPHPGCVNSDCTQTDGAEAADYQSASSNNPEVANISPLAEGTTQYTVVAVPYTPTQETLHMRIELLPGSNGGGCTNCSNFGGPDPTTPGVPRYQIFVPPPGTSAESSQGEFNIGFNPHTGHIFTMNDGPIWRLTPGEVQTPAKPECCEALWEDKSNATTNTGLDPILWTDQVSGRTFVSNVTTGANAGYGYTDSFTPGLNDGDQYVPAGIAPPNGGADHETIGTGPFPAAFSSLITPTNQGEVVYYCSQDVVGPAGCERSTLDLGSTFQNITDPYTGTGSPTDPCGGLHGHLHVAPDGTVWLPVNQCSGHQGGSFSTDMGTTWTEFTVPNGTSQTQGADPSIAIDADSKIYYAYVRNQSGGTEGHARVAVGTLGGCTITPVTNVRTGCSITWGDDIDLGTTHGIVNAAEIEAVGGSSGRAAVGFLGTDMPGDYQAISFPGKWYPFIATTYDGGATWTTVNATPNDPVQSMSGVWQQGGSHQDRNLLDFNEITIDNKGRVLYGYSDGCVTPGCIAGTAPNDFTADMRVARQSGGRPLLAAFDPNPVEPVAPKPPCLSGTRDSSGSHLTWKAPDNGGSDLTSYQILRGTTSGSEVVLVTGLPGDTQTVYNDTTADPNVPDYFYVVKAINSQGTGTQSNEIDLSVGVAPPNENLCTPPGLTKLTDGSGDNTPPAPGTDLMKFQIAQPYQSDGVPRLVFTITTDNGQSPQPTGSAWYVAMKIVNGANTRYAGVHMAWNPDSPATPAFESYVPGPNNTGGVDGRFVTPGSQKPAAATSSYASPFNKVIIIVKASDLGLSPGDTISGFVSGVSQSTDPGSMVGAGATSLYDMMPNSLAYTGTYTVTDNTACAPNGGPATHYAISAPASVPPDTDFNITVTAQDASNVTSTGYTGTAHITSSDSGAMFNGSPFPFDYTFTTADAGVHTFTVRLHTSGNQTITATDTVTPSITGTAVVAVGSTSPGNACLNAPTQVVTDPAGDQGAGNPSASDILSVSVGEDYRYTGNQRLVFVLRVNDSLSAIPPSQIWRVLWTFNAVTHYVAMTSDTSSNVTFDYGTEASNMITSAGALDDHSIDTQGNITMVVAMSKVGNPAAASVLTAVNGVTQMNVGGTLFTGEDSTSSADYTVRAQSGSCQPGPLPTTGTANYVKGGMTFSPNYGTKAPYIGQDVEPSVRCDKFGNCYVAAIRGVPGGTDLWYFDLRPTVGGNPNPNYDPYMRNPQYRGQPDGITGMQDAAVGGDGGGDVDIAVGFNPEATEVQATPPTLAYASLVAANVSTQRSQDRGATFTKNPGGNVTGGVPGDDRQWLEFYGPSTVYLFYRTLEPAVSQIQRSIDGGLTYGNTATAGAVGQAGGIAVDQNDGTVYISGSNGSVSVGIPPAAGLPPVTYTTHSVAGGGDAHLFFTVKVAADSTVYACYSNDQSVFIQYSRDKGNTWSDPIRVSDGAETLTAVFPWMTTGPVAGTIGVVWYGSTANSTGNDAADWHVFYALGTGVTGVSPTFRQAEASDHIIHAANISENGLVVAGQSPNRNLADYFQVAFDPTGAAVIGYCDDHNDISGHAYVTHQLTGPVATGATILSPPGEGGGLPAPTLEPVPTAASVGGIPGSQVTDFKDDVRSGGNPQAGGLVVVPTDDPLDILSILYTAEPTSAGNNAPVLVTTMKVSDMTTIPVSSNWRMTFTANAPNSVVSPTGQYSFGTSDRGDQFFVRASTDSAGAQTFVYGTAKRNFDGTIAYTDVGAADCGFFSQANKTITIKVALSKLNAVPNLHAALALGSTLAGLRGSTFTSANGGTSGNNKADTARGGTQFTISLGPLTSCGAPSAANGSVGGTIIDASGAPVSGVTINLSGTQSREAITDGSGKYSFDSVETNGFYTVTPARANYTFSPANRSFSLLGVHTEASFTATANNGKVNPLDTTEFFVRQHYLDFLNREPDPPGFIGWVNTINNCAAGDPSCDRVHVSEMFYRSAEFQERGYFAYRFYTTALGRKPDYAEFAPDLQQVSGFLTKDQLEAAKTAFADDFMLRPAFGTRYNSLGNAAYVDALMNTAGVSLANRQTLIDSLNNQTASRGQVLRQVAESTDVYQKYYNQAFVVMEYFGYLHRDPDALYTNWISVLDANPADARHMVDGFVNSTEYRNRFVP